MKTMIIHGIIIRAYPTKEQEEQIWKTIHATRYIYNWGLETQKEQYRKYKDDKTVKSRFSKYDMHKKITQLKKEPNHNFLKEADSRALQHEMSHLENAYKRFFSKQNKFPKFKSRKHSKHYKYTTDSSDIRINGNKIRLPKLGWVRIRWSNNIEFKRIIKVTVRWLPSGQYELSLLVESEKQVIRLTGQEVGIDLGVSTFAVCSNGESYSGYKERLKPLEEKLVAWQKKSARRRRLAQESGVRLEDAKNYQKAQLMVAKYYKKIVDVRDDYQHKLSKQLVEEYDLIALEDLRVKNLQKNRKLAHSISNQGFSEFIRKVQYKADWYGKICVIIDSRNTTQECSVCHNKPEEKLTLKDRVWACEYCDTHHDRDENAAINILNRGKSKLLESA